MSFAVAISTSSPQTSVALLGLDGAVRWSGERIAPQAASGACAGLLAEGLAETGLALADASLFLADLGPGSFTGVRVGVMMVKTLAFANGVMVAGLEAFDLLPAAEAVCLPSKKGEVFVRRGGVVERFSSAGPGVIGYGEGVDEPVYPHARLFGLKLAGLARVSAFELVPTYYAEPSISTPKKPFGRVSG